MRFLFIAAALVVTGCVATERSVVEIDGWQMQVEDTGQTWFASPVPDQGARSLGNQRFALNVRAIEAVSGCRVDPLTIDNNPYGYTSAAVSC